MIGQFEGHILQPFIMGKQVALSPVVVGIGVMAGTLVAGLLGAIIAIPIIAVIWAVFSSLYHRDPPIEGPLPDLPNRNGTGAHAHDSEDEDDLPAIKKILTDKLSIGGKDKEDEAGAKTS